MAEPYDFAIRTLAEQLYIIQGFTQKEVARTVGISISTVEGWSRAEGWRAKRKAYLADKAQKILRLIKIESKILSAMEADVQPTTIHNLMAGLRDIDRMIKEKTALGGPGHFDRAALFLDDFRFIAEVLKEVDPEALHGLSKNFDMIVSRFKERDTNDG